VSFVAADAASLPLPDESFDVVYSYNTFEHIPRPDAAVSEATRVLRPGGHLYLDFGPLYFSPFGLHAYYSITVPYCQHLWTPEVREAFIAKHDLPPVTDYVNGWSIERWRDLWRGFQDRLETLHYVETGDLDGLGLVLEFPSCFRSCTFESLVTGRISVLFRKRLRLMS
jgi:ubiquinone/menaquinone biosynthesis C-methylase UbiE